MLPHCPSLQPCQSFRSWCCLPSPLTPQPTNGFTCCACCAWSASSACSRWVGLLRPLPLLLPRQLTAKATPGACCQINRACNGLPLLPLSLPLPLPLLQVWGGTVFTNSISRCPSPPLPPMCILLPLAAALPAAGPRRLPRIAALSCAHHPPPHPLTPPARRWLQRYMSTAGLYLLNLVLALSVLVNLMGCIWWFVAEIEGLDNSWAAAVGEWGGPSLLSVGHLLSRASLHCAAALPLPLPLPPPLPAVDIACSWLPAGLPRLTPAGPQPALPASLQS
jgi:hypothetical protein